MSLREALATWQSLYVRLAKQPEIAALSLAMTKNLLNHFDFITVFNVANAFGNQLVAGF